MFVLQETVVHVQSLDMEQFRINHGDLWSKNAIKININTKHIIATQKYQQI